MWPLGLFRRITVSATVGAVSYGLVLAFLVLVALYPKELEPLVTGIKGLSDRIIAGLKEAAGTGYYGQLLVNGIRTHTNMAHVLVSIPAILIASVLVGMPLNAVLGSTRSNLQRLMIAICSVPASLVLVSCLVFVDLWSPGAYAAILDAATHTWDATLHGLRALGDTYPVFKSVSGVATIGANGHHYVIIAVCSSLAALVVNMLFALVKKPLKR